VAGTIVLATQARPPPASASDRPAGAIAGAQRGEPDGREAEHQRERSRGAGRERVAPGP
jgi:hypothetical protein